jgi:DNA repair exonuclease SbcCD ATPase subunit
VFLLFQDSNAAAAADIEEAMELTPAERAERIARLEAELRKAQQDLDELDQDLPANEMTAKAKEANIAELERELFALKTAQAVADRFPAGRNADEWRRLLRDAIRAGQIEGFELVLNILLLPSLGAGLIRGIAGIRSIRGFFAWLFRSRPPSRGPTSIPWNEYAEGYARRLDELKRVIAKPRRELDEFERAVGRLQEWVDEYTPMSPGPPR